MAGDWIKMRSNLWDDPRVAKICDITNQTEAAVVGALYWLWATADQHTEDGLLLGMSLRQIDRKTGVQGVGQALCDVGWLADQPDGVRIVRFEDHNGMSAKRRCTDAQRKANVRSASHDGPQQSRAVSACDADNARTGEGQEEDEKRRAAELEEEKRKSNTNPPTPLARGEAVESMFGEFWNSWPSHRRKVAMVQCQKKWQTAGCEAVASRILEALEAHKASDHWRKDAGEYIPAPLVWLKQRRWEAPMVSVDQVTVQSDAADRTRAELERRDAEWRAAQAAGGCKVPSEVLEAKTRIRALAAATQQASAERADA